MHFVLLLLQKWEIVRFNTIIYFKVGSLPRKYDQNWAITDFDSWPEPSTEIQEMRSMERPTEEEFKHLLKVQRERNHKLIRTAWEDTSA